MDLKYTYGDVLLKPMYSIIRSRKDVDLSVKFHNINLDSPLILAPMDTVSNLETAIESDRYGALTIIHRFMPIEEQCNIIFKLKEAGANNLAAAIGANEYERFDALIKAGANCICIDCANGWSIYVKETVEKLCNDPLYTTKRNQVNLIAGSVATFDATYDILSWGADSVRLGIGEGAVCTTRVQTGIGVPMISAIQAGRAAVDKFNSENGRKGYLIADGGIKTPGQASLALAAGADVVMCGSVFAGHEESPGEIVFKNNESNLKFKKYRGCASADIQRDMGRQEENIRAEGESILIPLKGPIKDTLREMRHGIQSCCSYMSAKNLKELRRNAINRFIQVSPLAAERNGVH